LWRFYPPVLGLQAMRGVRLITAVGMLRVGGLSRFEHPRQLMVWLGLAPSEHSSGERRRQGSIAKNGNSYARGCWKAPEYNLTNYLMLDKLYKCKNQPPNSTR
jgi:transposase